MVGLRESGWRNAGWAGGRGKAEVRKPEEESGHARRDSNPQPMVLETTTLPIELLASVMGKKDEPISFGFPPPESR